MLLRRNNVFTELRLASLMFLALLTSMVTISNAHAQYEGRSKAFMQCVLPQMDGLGQSCRHPFTRCATSPAWPRKGCGNTATPR